jgi:hypothetical protein
MNTQTVAIGRKSFSGCVTMQLRSDESESSARMQDDAGILRRSHTYYVIKEADVKLNMASPNRKCLLQSQVLYILIKSKMV